MNLHFGIEKDIVQFENLTKVINAFVKVYINENITGVNSILKNYLMFQKYYNHS